MACVIEVKDFQYQAPIGKAFTVQTTPPKGVGLAFDHASYAGVTKTDAPPHTSEVVAGEQKLDVFFEADRVDLKGTVLTLVEVGCDAPQLSIAAPYNPNEPHIGLILVGV